MIGNVYEPTGPFHGTSETHSDAETREISGYQLHDLLYGMISFISMVTSINPKNIRNVPSICSKQGADDLWKWMNAVSL